MTQSTMAFHGPDEHTTVDDIVALARSVLAYLAVDFAADLNPDRAASASRSLA